MVQPNASPFDRNGLTPLSDLKTTQWHDLFKVLENDQALFTGKQDRFRSPEYRWPQDSLHNWSRIWEYPYVYHHMRRFKSEWRRAESPVVADIGSGVTFFPFSVARLGLRVICTDIDPICEKDIPRAAGVIDHQPGKVEFRLASPDHLPFGDGELDAAYCVSVIEHIPEFSRTVGELARILKPGGLLLLTIDIALSPIGEIGAANHAELMANLLRCFGPAYPDTTVHPSDLLTTSTSPIPLPWPSGVGLLWFALKQWLLKPLLGMRSLPISRLPLTVHALTLIRTV